MQDVLFAVNIITSSDRFNRVIQACGALLAGSAVALSAYASHAGAPDPHGRLFIAAAFAFGHGIALTTLAPQRARRVGRAALCAWVLGVVLFSGSLAAAQLFAAPTVLAPAGGSMLIIGWLLYAVDVLRRD